MQETRAKIALPEDLVNELRLFCIRKRTKMTRVLRLALGEYMRTHAPEGYEKTGTDHVRALAKDAHLAVSELVRETNATLDRIERSKQ
jgi:hypothetical protein